MNENLIRGNITELPLGPLRYFDSLGSTNEEATRWAEIGAPHLALVVADEQTAGRGRQGRTWFTPPGAALAFSLVLRPEEIPRFAHTDINAAIPRLAGLAALAVCTALESSYGLQPQIKWPNDVLLDGMKTCGVLPELTWEGRALQAAVLGIGINIASNSVPPQAELAFPATCVEAALGRQVERWSLLREVLVALLDWLTRLDWPDFHKAWESRLAYRGDLVQLWGPGGVEAEGRLLGLDPSGGLRLQLPSAEEGVYRSGELSLRATNGRP